MNNVRNFNNKLADEVVSSPLLRVAHACDKWTDNV
jgi:hypothetical protein